MYFHSFRNPGLVVDIVSDLRRLNTMAVKAVQSGVIIVGGGVIKHHICNANLMRNGADFSVFINTASEYDGSDSGARPDEAVSWGKIKKDATPVKVYAEASLVFPILWYHYLVFSPIVWLMLRSGEQGAQNIIYAATESVTTPERNPLTGYFVSNVKMRRSKYHFDEETSVRLWEESVRAIAEADERADGRH
uniref:Deoxyhypusine synthase n=1 Tax=Anopheles farauti TaxID=69004 RepID=A0A182Q1S6_9DIPT